MNRQLFQTSKSKYLLSCDNINKYNLKNIFLEPYIKKVTSHIFLKDFLTASDFLNKTDINSNIQMKAVLFFYFIYSSFPDIVFQSIKVGKNSKKRNDGDFLLKINLTNKNTINSFLHSIFLEKANLFSNLSKSSLNGNSTFTKSVPKSFSYNVKLSGKTFFDINEFFSNKISDINLRQIKLDLSLIYSNMPKNININNLLKSSFFF
jgi:hypothetical protein